MSGAITPGYIAAIPRGNEAVRFTYEAVSKAESESIREGWRKLDHATQTVVAAEFLVDRLQTLEHLGTDKDGNPTWKPVEISEFAIQQILPHGMFARILWIVMGLHESDKDPDAPTATAPEPAAGTSTPEAATPPIAPQPEPAAGRSRSPPNLGRGRSILRRSTPFTPEKERP